MMDSINEFKATIEDETYGVDTIIPLVTPKLVAPIKVKIQGNALEEGTEISAFDDIVKEFSTLHIGFSKIPFSEFYGLQQVAASKIWLWENVVSYQETKQQRKEKAWKALLK